MKRVSKILILVILVFKNFPKCVGGNESDCNEFKVQNHQHFRPGANLTIDQGYFNYFISNILKQFDLKEFCMNINPHCPVNCSTIISLYIDNSTFLKFPKNFFTTFPELTIFRANKAGIMQIYRDDFKYGTNLKVLDLQGNMIESLEDGIISHMINLNSLDLSNNKIKSLSEGTFVGASDTLYKLNLSKNKIKVLDYLIFLPIASRKQYALELKMDNNEINEVKKSNNVKQLYFSLLSLNNNQISNFTCTDVKIKYASLNGNNLGEISLVDCSVEYIHVSSNNIKFLNLQSELKGVLARNNSIKNILISDNSQITHLDLSENKNISQALSRFKIMSKLEFLNISYSHPGILNEETFAEMKNLRYLHMKGCGLKIIPFRLFLNNQRMVTLDISDNSLETIDFHMFSGLKELKLLDISGNKLSRIVNIESIKNVLPELKEIAIEENPWKCYDLSIIARALKQLNVKIADAENKNFGIQHILGISCY